MWGITTPSDPPPMNSAVASVHLASHVLHVKGYALPGPHGAVRAVQVSADEGTSWTEARITYSGGRWGWSLWEAQVKDAGKGVVLSRAIDEMGNVQPEEGTWNLRGICYDGYGRKEY